MYAIFTDPTVGNEDVAGNCTWGPSSTPPWGNGWRAKSEWPDGLRDDLADDWEPTPAAETTDEKTAALDEEYQTKINDLATAYSAALLADAYYGTSTAAEILAEYEAAVAAYAEALEELE
jgi:hypothetical protein